MTDTLTTNLGLALQQTATNNNTWGTENNTNFSNVDAAAGGRLNKDVSGNSDITLNATEALNVFHNLTGTLTGNINYIFPASISRYYVLKNSATGAFTITVKQTGGAGLVVPQNMSVLVQINTGALTLLDCVNYLQSLTLASPLGAASGGTGASSASAALTALGGLAIANNLSDVASASSAIGHISPNTTKGDLLGFSSVNARLAAGTDGTFLTADSAQTLGLNYRGSYTNMATQDISFSICDYTGVALTTGVKGQLYIPYNCTIARATLLADAVGSVVVNVWKVAYASYPPTVTNKITASAPPTISSAQASTDATLTGWTTSISAGDTLMFNVDSCTTIKRATITLSVAKS